MDSESEIKRLNKIIDAYEKLTAMSRRELLDAEKTILAQENVAGLTQKEIRELHQQIDELKADAAFSEKIKNVLNEDSKNEAMILQELEQLRERSDESFYVDIFRVLAHHDFQSELALDYWKRILEHALGMEQKLNRPVGIRVAMLDFFINQNRILKNPMIIEIKIFDEMLKNSLMDELTGIYNRRYFDRSLQREMNRAMRHHHNLSIFLFDLDNFKQLNDRSGHAAGDEALKVVGQKLRDSFRKEDVACRYGGEEFAVLLPETDGIQAYHVANRFRETVEESSRSSNARVTLSGAVATYPENALDAGQLLLHADRLLYRAKESGKNIVLRSLR